ncbi:5594_t:CDS:2 [Paraglomus brasilianum]|uniref:5594_t:CDS:1 n=1 Tax=Paraglomus brasilianum TaxID=144538 RepID=A0A9N9A6F6_9GLOM|nr:5594_t:CDS:2 [Paraglomus brasilianum]
MSSLPTESDLDNLLHLENMFLTYGYEDGVEAGRSEGLIEGYVLGTRKAFEILQEIGFYDGVTKMWLKMGGKRLNERSIRHLTALSELIASFPTENQLNTEMLELLEKIRAKYKAIMAILKVGNNQKFKRETESTKMAY